MGSIPLVANQSSGWKAPETPLDAYSRVAQLKAQQQEIAARQQQMQQSAQSFPLEQQKRQLELQATQREAQDQQTVMQVLQAANGDLGAALPQLASKVSPKTYMGLADAHLKMRRDIAGLTKDELANQTTKNDQALGLIEQARALPPEQYQQEWPNLVNKAKEIHADFAGQLDPAQPIPQEHLDKLELGIKTHSQALAQRQAEATINKKEAPTATEQDFQVFYKSKLAAMGAQPNPKAEFAARQEFAAMHRAPKNDEGEDAVLQRVAAKIAPMDPRDLSSLKDIVSLRGDQRLKVFDYASRINPKFNTAEVNRKIKMLDNFSNGKDGQQLQSFGTFLEHAGEASRVVNDIRNHLTPAVINTAINKLESKGWGTTAGQITAALEPVRKEFEGFLLGGRALYGDDRKAAETILSDSSTPAQIQAALKQMGHTVKARQNEMNSRFKNQMGANITDVIGPMSEEAMQGARDIGLDMGGGGKEVKMYQGIPYEKQSDGSWKKKQ